MRKTNTIGTGTVVQEKGEMNVFKKSKRLIPLFMAAMMLTTAIGASAQELPKDPDWESKIDQELKAAMEKADKGEKIPVAVWLRDETVLETVDRRLKEEKNLDPEVFEDQEKFQTEVVDKVTEKLEAQLGVEEANKKKEAEELVVRLKDIILEFQATPGKDGRMFGSISSKQVCEAMKERHGILLDKRKFVEKDTVNVFGITTMKIELYKGVIGTFKVHVSEKVR